MATKYFNAVLFTSSTSGTADFGVGAVVQGYQSPAAAGAVNADPITYRAESADLSQWEEGRGTYSTIGPVITRGTVVNNSLGTTSKINFIAAPTVGLVQLALDIIQPDNPVFTGAVTALGGFNLPTSAASAFGIDMANQAAIPVPNGAHVDLNGIIGGIFFCFNTTNNSAAIYIYDGGAGTSFAALKGTTWVDPTNTPAAGNSSIFFNGSTSISIYNNIGSSQSYKILTIRGR